MGKLGALLVAAGPTKGGATDDEAGDPESDPEAGGEHHTLESAGELANLLMKGKGYNEDGSCTHMPVDEDMKDPSHPLQHGLRAFKRAHDAAMSAQQGHDRDSARRAEDKTPGRTGY